MDERMQSLFRRTRPNMRLRAGFGMGGGGFGGYILGAQNGCNEQTL